MSLPGRPKGEYRSAQHKGAPVSLCLVTDTDDPAVSSSLLRASLDLAAESTSLHH